MKDLMYFSQEHPEFTVPKAIQVLVETYKQNPPVMQHPINSQQMAAQQQFLQQNPQINMAPNSGGQPPGSRTPNAPMHNRLPGVANENFVNMSPAMQHNLLPVNGSPHISGLGGLNPGANLGQTHTPSPAQAPHMPPPMAPQSSQAGSAASGSGMSQNTSPSQNTKRRRSTVAGMKSEDDGGGGDINGTPSGGQGKKATPRIQHKRVKAN
jgi:hypothetical protein